MSAYLIGHITVKDPEKWSAYVRGVQASLDKHDASIIFRGKRSRVFTGDHHHDHTVVIQFPDQASLQQWYESGEYQELIPIRDEAADVVIVGYDT